MNLWDKLNQMTQPPEPDPAAQALFDLGNYADAQTTNITPPAAQMSKVLLRGQEVAGPAYPVRAADQELAPVQAAPHIMTALGLIKKWEKFKSTPYPDGKTPTGEQRFSIGYGQQESPFAQGQEVNMAHAPIDEATAEMGVLKRLQELDDSLTGPGFDVLNPNQRAAVLDLMYNIGERQFLKSTLADRLREGDYPAAEGEFTKWVYGGGKKLKGLLKRRNDEVGTFKTPTNHLKNALDRGLSKDIFEAPPVPMGEEDSMQTTAPRRG